MRRREDDEGRSSVSSLPPGGESVGRLSSTAQRRRWLHRLGYVSYWSALMVARNRSVGVPQGSRTTSPSGVLLRAYGYILRGSRPGGPHQLHQGWTAVPIILGP